jgi:predicted acyl esterase
VVEVTVEMLPIIWEIQPGSRIRIDISSSDFPQYSVHSNYPGVWSEQTKTRIATQTVHTGKKYPIRVMIPIL